MDQENKTEPQIENEKPIEPFNNNYSIKTPSGKTSFATIAGILLIVAGALAVVNWYTIFSLDETTLDSFVNISQFKQINQDITAEQVLSFFKTCAVVGFIISVFQILGGVLSIKRKLWGVSLTCSIIGIFSIGILFSSTLFSLIALVLLIISRKEFQ
jgi:hypothetical protein